MTRFKTFTKDPDATLDYQVNWSNWLNSGDTISASSWSSDAGITIESDLFDTLLATVWLSGGTEDETYSVVNHITTVGGRINDQTILIQIKSH